MIDIKLDAFNYKKNYAPRNTCSGRAGDMAKLPQVKKICEAILNPKLNPNQQALAFQCSMNHKLLQTLVKSVGLKVPEETQAALHHMNQQKRLIQAAFSEKSEKLRSRTADDNRSFIESNLVAISNSPQGPLAIKKSDQIRALGLNKRTGYRLLNEARKKRRNCGIDKAEM